jgi:hypothetical protein
MARRGQAPPPGREAPTTLIWTRPRRLGFAETLRTGGGVVAPLLAGFSLATIATIATLGADGSGPRLADWSMAALAAAVGLLLFAMQTASVGLSHSAPPGDRLDWYPEARTSREALDFARWENAVDAQLRDHYWVLTWYAYDLGLIAFLIGLLLLLVPSDWTLGRGIAVGVACLALAVELRWAGGNLVKKRWKAVLKGEPISAIVLPQASDASYESVLSECHSTGAPTSQSP